MGTPALLWLCLCLVGQTLQCLCSCLSLLDFVTQLQNHQLKKAIRSTPRLLREDGIRNVLLVEIAGHLFLLACLTET